MEGSIETRAERKRKIAIAEHNAYLRTLFTKEEFVDGVQNKRFKKVAFLV